jgi:hypothetical protein
MEQRKVVSLAIQIRLTKLGKNGLSARHFQLIIWFNPDYVLEIPHRAKVASTITQLSKIPYVCF